MAVSPQTTPQALDANEEVTQRNDYIKRFIEFRRDEHTPDKARISETGVSVAAVIYAFRGTGGDIEQTMDAYDLSLEAVIAALVYYACHSELINARNLLNDAHSIDWT